MLVIADKQREYIWNPLVKLILNCDKKIALSVEDSFIVVKWLNALNIPEFEQYVIDLEFDSHVEFPLRFKHFLKFKIKEIAVSEPSVERCFNVPKRIH